MNHKRVNDSISFKLLFSYPPLNKMPPKGGAAGASKKAETKAKQKIVEDKTFGLKNKNKSAKVNKYVQQVEKTVMQGNRKVTVIERIIETERRARFESPKGTKES